MKLFDKMLYNSLNARNKYRLDLLGGVKSYDSLIKHLQLLAKYSQVPQNDVEIYLQFTEYAFIEVTKTAKKLKNLEIITLALSKTEQLKQLLADCKKNLKNIKFKAINNIAIIEEIAFQITRHSRCALDESTINGIINVCKLHFQLSEYEVQGLQNVIKLYKINLLICSLYCYCSNIHTAIVSKCLINICKCDTMLETFTDSDINCGIISGKLTSVAVSKFSTLTAYDNSLVTKNSGAYNNNGLVAKLFRGNMLIADSYTNIKLSDVAALCTVNRLGVNLVCKTTVVNDCELRQYFITNTYKHKQQLRLSLEMNFDNNCTLIDKQQYCIFNQKTGVYSSIYISEETELQDFCNNKLKLSVNLTLMPDIQIKFIVAVCLDNNYQRMCYKYSRLSGVDIHRDNFVSLSNPAIKSKCADLVKFATSDMLNSVKMNTSRQIVCAVKYKKSKDIFLSGDSLDCCVNSSGCIGLMCSGRVSVNDDNQQMWLIVDRQAFCWDKAILKIVNDSVIMSLDTPKIKAVCTIIVNDGLDYYFKYINKSNKQIKVSQYIRYNLTGKYTLKDNSLCSSSKRIYIVANNIQLTHKHYGAINLPTNSVSNGDCLILSDDQIIEGNSYKNSIINLAGNTSTISVNPLIEGSIELENFNIENIKLSHLLNNGLINSTAMLLYTLSFSTHFIKDYCVKGISSISLTDNTSFKLDKYAYILGILNYINLTNDKTVLDYNAGKTTIKQYIICMLSILATNSYEQVMRAKCIKLAANVLEDRYLFVSLHEQISDKIVNGDKSTYEFALLVNALPSRYYSNLSIDDIYSKYKSKLPPTYRQLMLLEHKLGMKINCGIVSFCPISNSIPYKNIVVGYSDCKINVCFVESLTPQYNYSGNYSIDLFNKKNNGSNISISI